MKCKDCAYYWQDDDDDFPQCHLWYITEIPKFPNYHTLRFWTSFKEVNTMSRSKHLYQVILIHLDRNVFLPDEVQIWANNKRQLYQICDERYPDKIVFYARYIK